MCGGFFNDIVWNDAENKGDVIAAQCKECKQLCSLKEE